MYNPLEEFENWFLNTQLDPKLPFENFLNSFIRLNSNLSDEQQQKCAEYIESFQNRKNIIIFNVRHLVYLLNNYSNKKIFFRGIDEDRQISEIYWMSHGGLTNGKSKIWDTFYIPKRNKSLREINAPNELLMSIQRWIYDSILLPTYLNKSDFNLNEPEQRKNDISRIVVHGFLPGKSIVTNAMPHVNRATILKIDLQDFFPSISSDRIYFLFKKLGYTIELSNILTGLCTFKEKVPQGAPTSPILSNFICRNLDIRLYYLCKKYGFRYTRYADDLTISGSGNLVNFEETIERIINEEGFIIAQEKKQYYKQGTKHLVTGIVSNEKINVDKKIKKRLRAILHNCEKNGILNDVRNQDVIFKNQLFGKISFINMIRPDLAKILAEKANSLDWTDYDEWRMKELSEDLIKENEPFSNLRKISRVIQKFENEIVWIDKYFSKTGLELLMDNINKTKVKNITILMSVNKTNDKLKNSFEDFKNELSHKGIKTELRVIVDKNIEKSFHDRWIFSTNFGYLVPSVDVFKRGQYSEIKPTTSRPPYLDWIRKSKDIIKDWDDIKRLKQEIDEKKKSSQRQTTHTRRGEPALS